MHVFHSLAPVFAILALGFALRRLGFVTPDLIRGTNRLVYWIGLPCVLFAKISDAPIRPGERGDAILVLLCCTAVCMAAGYLAAWCFGARGGTVGTVVQAAFRGNLAFVGLPVIIYSSAHGDADPTVPVAVILLSALVPLYNIFAVTALLASQHRLGAAAVRKVLLELATNPLVLAALGGVAWSLGGLSMPISLGRTLDALGQMALPLALLGVGAGLELRRVRDRDRGLTILASLIKVGLGPAAGYLLAGIVGLSPVETRIVCVYLACPTAAASYVLADQLGGERSLAAGTVALSTVLSLASLSLALLLT